MWNFKNGGSKKARFLAKNQHPQRKSLHFMNAMNFGLSKSAKIYLIFFVKNWQNFLIFFSLMNINSGDHFLLKTFFSNLNFWTTLFFKIMSNFWQTGIPHIHKIRWFPLSMLTSGQKPCFLGPAIPQLNWHTIYVKNELNPCENIYFCEFT